VLSRRPPERGRKKKGKGFHQEKGGRWQAFESSTPGRPRGRERSYLREIASCWGEGNRDSILSTGAPPTLAFAASTKEGKERATPSSRSDEEEKKRSVWEWGLDESCSRISASRKEGGRGEKERHVPFPCAERREKKRGANLKEAYADAQPRAKRMRKGHYANTPENEKRKSDIRCGGSGAFVTSSARRCSGEEEKEER